MIIVDVLTECQKLGAIFKPEEDGNVLVSPPGVLPKDLRAQLQAHKPQVHKLLTAPPADVMREAPCPICESRGTLAVAGWPAGLCRVCFVLDLAPLTPLRQG